MRDPRWPDDACRVVYQRNQFSWTRPDDPQADHVKAEKPSREEMAFAYAAARKIVGEGWDPTRGATHYHADSVSPRWRAAMTETRRIGRHAFLADR